jgi:hypothetical protein
MNASTPGAANHMWRRVLGRRLSSPDLAVDSFVEKVGMTFATAFLAMRWTFTGSVYDTIGA